MEKSLLMYMLQSHCNYTKAGHLQSTYSDFKISDFLNLKKIAGANSSTIFTFFSLFISSWNAICHKSGTKSGCEHDKNSLDFCDLYAAKAKFNSKCRQQKTT